MADGAITFHTVTVPVPASRVVRIPVVYPHEFASIPLSWREVTVPHGPKYLSYPTLDPAHARRPFPYELR